MDPNMIKSMAKGAIAKAPHYILGQHDIAFTGSFAAYAFYVFIASWRTAGLFTFTTVYVIAILTVGYFVGELIASLLDRRLICPFLARMGIATQPAAAAAGGSNPMGNLLGMMGGMGGGGLGGAPTSAGPRGPSSPKTSMDNRGLVASGLD
jgi:hypothetical protein